MALEYRSNKSVTGKSRRMISYGKQSINEEDIACVVDVLRSSHLTQGKQVNFFEEAMSNICSVSFAISVNSGTAALHIACLSLGLKAGDVVWTSPISFVASANCAKYCGAEVDFVDIEMNTGLMSVSALEEKLIKAKIDNCLPKIVIPVHYSGQSCNMKKIASLSNEYGFKIIEDACHALGATYEETVIGECKYSDVTVFSFHPVKMITTGEGGVAVTNSEKLSEKMYSLRSHGIEAKQGITPWFYEQKELGYNYRMPDINASLGLSQLKRLSGFVEKRRKIANRYLDKIISPNVSFLTEMSYGLSCYHLFPILLKSNEKRLSLYNKLLENDIKTQVHYIPIYKQPYYKNIKGNWPNSEEFYSRVLSIPIYFDLDFSLQKEVSNIINSI
jgi:UDP-4-amino-4,6-dideoxy-N-acetyl-beta-L-altrosamine transaminase